jgi:acyl-CoA dehydrogenase
MNLEQKTLEFARQHIAGRTDLQDAEGFPFDLWQEMGRQGLLGLGLPEAYGGLGGDLRAVMAAGRGLVRGGHNLGIALSWLSHTMVGRFLIHWFGNAQQRERYLPGLAAGRIIPAVAISEPGAGAHPKRLSTRAERDGERYLLNGEKAYLTNGPIADLFVVLAVTAVEDGRKRFTAFLVPRQSPGLSLTTAGAVDFLRPSPHGGIKLENCAVPASEVLGAEGTAFETMSKPLRELEDVVGIGPVLGGMGVQLDLLVALAAAREVTVTDRMREELGGLRALLVAVEAVAFETAGALEGGAGRVELPTLLVGARNLLRQFQDSLTGLREELGAGDETDFDRFSRDMSRLVNLGRNVNLLRQQRLGEWTPSKED